MEGHSIGGIPLSCGHCGAEDFGEGATDLEGVVPLTGQGALRAFVCEGCGAVQLFLARTQLAPWAETVDASDVTEPDPGSGESCLACGARMRPDQESCSACGWTYETGTPDDPGTPLPAPPLVPEPPPIPAPPPIPEPPDGGLDVVSEEDLAAAAALATCRICGEPRQPGATICRSCGRLYDG